MTEKAAERVRLVGLSAFVGPFMRLVTETRSAGGQRATIKDMSRTQRLVLLAALCVGAFLVGVELLVTAVALPSIVADLADWTRLREASWIINGYLVAYVAVMPLAGRAADRYSLPRLFAISLGTFAIGSVLAGAAPNLEWLIVARVVQGLGAGAILPLATAGASHLFEGATRARAIGVVGALTFLGMAVGPLIGATIIQTFDSWRWIFYLAAPFAVLAIVYVWAAGADWRRTTERTTLDIAGAVLFTTAVASGLLALTTLGQDHPEIPLALAVMFVVSLALAIRHFARAVDPFIDLRYFRDRTFSGAVLLSLLTGYALATAIIGGAVFIDRVRYAGPSEQQLALGGLAGAMAIGALGSGFVLRRTGVTVLSLVGLALAIGGLLLLSSATVATPLGTLVVGLSLFGFGFGLTVTARSTAAVEALGRKAFGAASASVTVARMLGMGVGLAALTVLGSNRIEALSIVLTNQAARDAVLPPSLQGRPLEDYLVVNALESWAADRAADILSTLFLVAAVVTAVAILPTLAMRNRPVASKAGERGLREGVSDAVEDGSTAGIAI